MAAVPSSTDSPNGPLTIKSIISALFRDLSLEGSFISVVNARLALNPEPVSFPINGNIISVLDSIPTCIPAYKMASSGVSPCLIPSSAVLPAYWNKIGMPSRTLWANLLSLASAVPICPIPCIPLSPLRRQLWR
jgi:hypothetical protein